MFTESKNVKMLQNDVALFGQLYILQTYDVIVNSLPMRCSLFDLHYQTEVYIGFIYLWIAEMHPIKCIAWANIIL